MYSNIYLAAVPIAELKGLVFVYICIYFCIALKALNVRFAFLRLSKDAAVDSCRVFQELDLSNNYLDNLPAGLFRDMSNLTRLTLHNNSLTVTDRELFQVGVATHSVHNTAAGGKNPSLNIPVWAPNALNI